MRRWLLSPAAPEPRWVMVGLWLVVLDGACRGLASLWGRLR